MAYLPAPPSRAAWLYLPRLGESIFRRLLGEGGGGSCTRHLLCPAPSPPPLVESICRRRPLCFLTAVKLCHIFFLLPSIAILTCLPFLCLTVGALSCFMPSTLSHPPCSACFTSQHILYGFSTQLLSLLLHAAHRPSFASSIAAPFSCGSLHTCQCRRFLRPNVSLPNFYCFCLPPLSVH